MTHSVGDRRRAESSFPWCFHALDTSWVCLQRKLQRNAWQSELLSILILGPQSRSPAQTPTKKKLDSVEDAIEIDK